MKRCYILLLLGVGLTNTLKSNEILKQALLEHAVDYSHASQLSRDHLGGLFLAQDAQDLRRIQIKSVSQSLTGDECELRGASCGYHALRNGTLTALSLLDKGEAQSKLKQIASQRHANELFGTKIAPWRIEIGRLRNESTARKIFRERIVKGFNHQVANKEFDLLMRCVGEINVPALARPAVWEDGFHYSVSKKEVYEALAERLNKFAAQGTKDQQVASKALLANRATLDQYFDKNLDVDFKIDFEGACTFTNSQQGLTRVPGVRYGNWVQSDEMPSLVNAQRDNGILVEQPMLLVATYGEDHGGDEHHAFASEKFTQLYSLIRETDDDCVGVVLVYLSSGASSQGAASSVVRNMLSWFGSWFSSQKGKSFAKDAEDIRSVQDNGHWITLVVSRIKGDVRYYTLDSLGNSNRLRNSRVNEIIDILDGKKSLAGYSWTAKQVAKQSSGMSKAKATSLRSVGKTQLKNDLKKEYSWTQIGLGTLVTGLVAYGAYAIYNDQKKKKNP